MSGARFSLFVGFSLSVCAILCIGCNIALFFPGWSAEAAQDPAHKLTPEVTMLVGIAGGGIMVLIPAIVSLVSRKTASCTSRCGMFLSIWAAAIGLCGSLFCLVMSVVAMMRGPVCEYYSPLTTYTTPMPTANYSLVWGRPFEKPMPQYNNESYIYHKESWDICVAPHDVVKFHITFFSVLMAEGSIEVLICTVLLFYTLFSAICGPSRQDDFNYRNMKEDTAVKC